jgi:hypothetical protein
MDIYRECSEGHTHIIGQKCDVCDKSTSSGDYIPIELTLEGEIYHFCSYEHAIEFLTAELKKENK